MRFLRLKRVRLVSSEVRQFEVDSSHRRLDLWVRHNLLSQARERNEARGRLTERTGFERSSTSETGNSFDSKLHETSDSRSDDGNGTSVISSDCKSECMR